MNSTRREAARLVADGRTLLKADPVEVLTHGAGNVAVIPMGSPAPRGTGPAPELLAGTWTAEEIGGAARAPGVASFVTLTAEGEALLEAMPSFGFGLDLSHMDEQAALQALDRYEGQVLASHANCLALLKGSDSNRHLSDRVIAGLVERGGVIGVVPYNSFLKTGWKKGDNRAEVTLADLVAHIDHICQIAGDAKHAGFGSDFEGGFGRDETPAGLDTIADLHAVVPLLEELGYSREDIAGILGGNWRTLLDRILPD